MLRYDVEKIKLIARGREAELLEYVGHLPREVLDGGHHPCPNDECKSSKDGFRFDAKKGFCICASCFDKRNGDILAAIQHFRGITFPEVLKEVAYRLGVEPNSNNNGKPVNGQAVDPLQRLATVKRCPVESLRAYGAKSDPTAKCVAFPMYSLAFPSGEPVRCSTFTVWPESDDAKLVKGLNAKGRPAGMFLPHNDDGAVMYPEPGDTWVIVEGVKDAAALQAMGYHVVGLPGKSIKREWVPMFKGVDCVLCLDNDQAGQEATPKLVKDLHDTAASVRVVKLPAAGDARDNIAAAGVDAVKAAIEAAAAPGQDEAPPEPPAFTKLLTSAEFLELDLRPRFLVKNIMVAGQPLVLGARSKSMKTSLAVDLAISLGSGSPFLGEFPAERATVAFWCGESGAATIRETAQRIARSKGVDLSDCSVLWSFDLPKLSHLEHLDALRDAIQEHKIQVAIIDPLYLSLLTAETAGGASNVYMMGAMLQPLTAIGQETGCTLVVLHHFRKSGIPAPEEPAALEELSQSGVAEWARQWILLQRRSPYQSDGRHELWLRAGGSAGHGGLFAIDIEEGVLDPETFTGRHWDVTVKTAGDTRQEVRRERENRKAEQAATKEADHRRRVLVAMQDHPEGETERTIRIDAGLNSENFARAARQLVKEMRIFATTIEKNGKNYPGFRLSKGATEQVEQVEQVESVPLVPVDS